MAVGTPGPTQGEHVWAIVVEPSLAGAMPLVLWLLKENVRLLDIEQGWDIVFIARHDIVTADYGTLSTRIVKLLNRAGILHKDDEKFGSEVN